MVGCAGVGRTTNDGVMTCQSQLQPWTVSGIGVSEGGGMPQQLHCRKDGGMHRTYRSTDHEKRSLAGPSVERESM